MSRGFLILIPIFILSCSKDKQEPIFHPFERSQKYPHYDEVDFLKNEGFYIKTTDRKFFLTKSEGKIGILYEFIDDDIFAKITRIHLNTFDTIQADKEIKNFGGLRVNNWKVENDTTMVTSVSFNSSEIELKMINRHNEKYLETTFNLWHRVIN